MKSTLLASLVLASTLSVPALVVSAQAQDLPDICPAPAMADHMGHETSTTEHTDHMQDEAHMALGAGLDEMHATMNAGMTAEDIDIAFVCGMIPHHQGAIVMAKAVLDHGDDPFVRELAQGIIDAQEQEITAMREWLAQQSE